MEGKIPVPTDNIFKFYALFSLLLFVFAVGATIYVNRSINDRTITFLVELETLKQEKTPTQPQQLRISILERQLEVGKSDREFYRWSLAALTVLGLVGMVYGFTKWHQVVQPIADEAARVQLEIAKIQLAKLRAELKVGD